ncbi:ankyrin-1-like [Ostrea edulis]|uniref:ankyrin-1-like n=1 Tax=Ostrea edulis TaxID=37623 RepID=UPI0024AF26B8|nr:ankyrin-1-like [Ostrea edulis]
MFVFHDPIGKESLIDFEYEKWKRYERTLKTYLKEVKILLSCRLCVFHDERLKGIMKETNNSIRIDDGACKLSRDEKRKILHQYTENVKFAEDETEEIIKSDAYFPLLCKLYSIESKYEKRGLSFFKNPFEVVREEIEIYQNSERANEKSKYCSLIFLVVFNNNVKVNDMEDCPNSHFPDEKYEDILRMSGLPDNTPITSVITGFKSLEGSFVRCVGNSYTFIHDFVQEITTVVIGARFPKQTIKYADSGFLRRRVKIEDDKQERNPFTVYLTDGYIDDLVQRFLLDIQTEDLLDVVLNPCLQNKKVIESFIKHLEKEIDVSLDLKRKLVKVDEYEFGKLKENNLISRLGFFLTQEEVTPLSALIIFCHDEIALSCLKNYQLSDKFSTFASICANGNTTLYDVYLQKYAVEFSNVVWGGFYALHIASLFHNFELTQTLIGHTKSINMFDDHRFTSLMCAVLNDGEANSLTTTDSLATIQCLLTNGADINLCNNDGLSPLFIACHNGHDSTVKLLLNNGANINLCMKNGVSPLYIACQNGHDRTVQLLLNNGADINLCMKNEASPLYIACQNGHDSTLQLLLNNGADINLCMNNGASPLYIACQIGHDSTVQLLLNNGADINLYMKNGASPLYIACENGHDSTVQLLLNNCADINLYMKNGASPLYIACENGHDSTVQLLLNKGADNSLCTEKGVSPLYIACQNGHDSTVQLLLNKGADNSLCTEKGVSPLYIACHNGDDSTVQLLLNNCADINLCDNDATSPLYIACHNGHDSTLQLLLDNGADINLCMKNGASPLYIACQNGHDSTVQLLLNNGADINLCMKNGASPLYIACQNGHDSTVQLLLNNGADINLCEENGASPLYIACQNGHYSTVQLLLNKGADNCLCTEKGVSPLYIACHNGHYITVQLLLNNGADINLCDNDGASPLYIACQNGHDSTVQLLLNNGAVINLCDNDGDSHLHAAR